MRNVWHAGATLASKAQPPILGLGPYFKGCVGDAWPMHTAILYRAEASRLANITEQASGWFTTTYDLPGICLGTTASARLSPGACEACLGTAVSSAYAQRSEASVAACLTCARDVRQPVFNLTNAIQSSSSLSDAAWRSDVCGKCSALPSSLHTQ